MENNKNIKKVNLKLPEKTHKQIKIMANIKGITINELINQILEKELNQVNFNKLIRHEL